LKKKVLFIIIRAILGAVIVFAASLFFMHIFAPSSLFDLRGAGTLDISEVNARGSALLGQQINVRGQVTPGSVNSDEQIQAVTFILTDGRNTLNVMYRGKLPNNFKPGAVLIVQGRYRPNGVFEANGFGRGSSICIICHG